MSCVNWKICLLQLLTSPFKDPPIFHLTLFQFKLSLPFLYKSSKPHKLSHSQKQHLIQMSTSFYYTLVLCLLLLLSSIDTNMAARKIPSSAPSTIVRPLVSEAQDYVTMKPLFKHKHRVFRGKEVKNCLPKGFRHSSAPSRFVNYHTLGGLPAGCFSRKKPWCMVYAWEFKIYGGDVCICFLGFHGAVEL